MHATQNQEFYTINGKIFQVTFCFCNNPTTKPLVFALAAQIIM